MFYQLEFAISTEVMIAVRSLLYRFTLGILLLATRSTTRAQIQDVTIVLSQGTIVGVIQIIDFIEYFFIDEIHSLSSKYFQKHPEYRSSPT